MMIERDSHMGRSGAVLEDAPLREDAPAMPAESLIGVLTQLARRKRLIAKITGTAAVVSVIVSLLLPVRYTAATRIMTPQQTQSSAAMMMSQLSNAGAGSLIAAAAGGGGLGLKNPNDIYIGLLNSRPIADAIITQFDLKRLYRSRDMTAARKKLAENTTIASEKSGLLAISVTDKDRARSAAIANAYTAGLRSLSKTLAVTEASQRRLFYEDQLKHAKDNLVAAESTFQQVQQKRGLVHLDAQAKAMIAGLADLRAQVAAKQVQLQAMRSYSTEQNPDVQLAERELASLQAEVVRLDQRTRSSDPGNLGMGDLAGSGLDYITAEHELQYRQILFDLLLKQYDAARLDEAKDAAIIQVVEPAIEPDRRSSPKRVLIILLSIVAGFFAACMVALFQWWRELIKFDTEAEKEIQGLKYALFGRKAKPA
jgi:tyrosine-protein kinase Etk/Wzc